MRSVWQGKINNSSIELATKVVQCKNDDKSKRINASLGALILFSAIFGMVNGLDIRNWFDSILDSILIGLWIVSAVFYVWYSNKDYKSEYEKYRVLLMDKINAGFCPCTDGCNHKEEFMKYMDEEFGIKLYY